MHPIVLLVDDDPSVTSGTRTALHRAPFTVLVANSGAEALAQLASNSIDVVVSDERMPGMSGSELLSRVRKEYPDTMRLILSGQADLKDVVRAINGGGIYRFLLKPCNPMDLAASISEALDALENRRRYQRWQAENIELTDNSDATLDRALDSISMAFQPIYCNAGEDIYAYEALVRPRDPEVSDPGKLFGLADAVKRVPDVDYAIRKAILGRLSDLPKEASLFFNLHPDSLMDERILSGDDVLAAHAERVVIEITESSPLHDTDTVVSRIGRLRELGYRIALDDLGAGYAGLSSFALLSPDVVKFDMELIRGIHKDNTRSRLVESMAALCKEMDILTIAEGIESEDEMRCALKLGCDLIQGYHLARPSTSF
jgi:EAL domain-containing protein (putative c-di-GMP-specific phosphodiesterase class I)